MHITVCLIRKNFFVGPRAWLIRAVIFITMSHRLQCNEPLQFFGWSSDGCFALFQDCYFEKQDWRLCRQEIEDFRKCMAQKNKAGRK